MTRTRARTRAKSREGGAWGLNRPRTGDMARTIVGVWGLRLDWVWGRA